MSTPYVRPCKLVHQILSINNIDFSKRSFIGVTQLQILPQKVDLRTIKLNCKQCKIFQIIINNFIECQFDYCDPTLEICPKDNKLRNLDTFTKRHHDAVGSTDPEKNLGEIIVHIPTQLYNHVAEGKMLTLNIEFGLENPAGGIHFVIPEGELVILFGLFDDDNPLLRQ